MSEAEQKVVDDVQRVCKQAVELGKHFDLTVRQVIQTLIDDMGHDESFLKSKPIKKLIKETAAESLESGQPEPDITSDKDEPKETPSKKRASSHKDSSSRPPSKKKTKTSPKDPNDSQVAADGAEELSQTKRSPSPSNKATELSSRPQSKKKARASSKGGFKSSEMVDSDGNSIHEEEPTKSTKPPSKPQSKKERKIKGIDDTKAVPKTNEKPTDGDDAQDPSDGEEKTTSSATAKKNGKGRRESLPLDKDEERIKKLKSFIVACGMRKQWKKEFQDRPTRKQQIQHLTKILEGLGMTGRLSMNKAKEIKARRDLEAEVNELVASNQVDSSDDDDQVSLDADRKENQIKKRKKNRTVDDSSGDESSDSPSKPQAKRNPFAFLGDQGSDDSS